MSFYVTTPIYYVNDRPHIGHCYTTLLGDALARFRRLQQGLAMDGTGTDSSSQVFLLTGTDEHAEKVVTTAAAQGLSAMAWADQNSAAFEAAFREMNLSFDDFIRTTQDRHKTRVKSYLSRLLKTGDVAQGEYEGWYDVNDEAYVTETNAKESNYLAGNGKPLVRRKEKNYYFKLSKYQSWLEAAIAKGEVHIEPEARRNEVLGRLREGLQDVPITRPVTDDPATQFGIRMPGDAGHRVYVWIDALFNYLSAVDTPERRHLWPPAVHLMGKEILWFHAVIWPALLHALGEPLPRLIYAHSHYTRDGKKMSKSLGNFISLEVMQAYMAWAPNKDKIAMGVDPLRWYLLTQGPLGATDADFSHHKFVEVYNADLANGIGNCASRVGNMIDKYFGGKVPDHQGHVTHQVTESDGVHRVFDWPTLTADSIKGAASAMDRCDLARALGYGIDLIRQVDIYINVTRPFALAKLVDKGEASRDGLGQILYQCAEAVRVASLLLAPAIPGKMESLWKAWGCTPPPGVPLETVAQFAGPHGLKPGQSVGKGEILFMRADANEVAPA